MISPHSIEAEQSVLGSMLISSVAVDEAIQILNREHFYKESHSEIFSTISALVNSKKPIDTLNVIEHLKKKKKLKSCGGAYYITGLVETVPTASNVKSYANIVKKIVLIITI